MPELDIPPCQDGNNIDDCPFALELVEAADKPLTDAAVQALQERLRTCRYCPWLKQQLEEHGPVFTSWEQRIFTTWPSPASPQTPASATGYD